MSSSPSSIEESSSRQTFSGSNVGVTGLKSVNLSSCDVAGPLLGCVSSAMLSNCWGSVTIVLGRYSSTAKWLLFGFIVVLMWRTVKCACLFHDDESADVLIY